jgi:hypothetical protein
MKEASQIHTPILLAVGRCALATPHRFLAGIGYVIVAAGQELC